MTTNAATATRPDAPPRTESEVRLEHALITVKDHERSLGFYRRLFPGWTIRWEGRGSGGHRWIHLGPPGEGQPTYLSLSEVPDAAAPDEAYVSHRIQHIGFAHPDVNALVARARAAGLEPSDTVDDGRYRRAYYDDPDGVELEFVQKLAG